MNTRQKINTEFRDAMRSGDTVTRDTLRLLLAALKQSEIDSGETLDEEGVQAVLAQQAKQRRESITVYMANDREDLAAGERLELEIITRYLPQQLTRVEIETLAREAIDAAGATDMRGMGSVMGVLMPRVKGRADGKLVSQVVRELLQST